MTRFRAALSRRETASLKDASSGEASVFFTRVFIRDLMALFLRFAFLLDLSLFLADLCAGTVFLLAFWNRAPYDSSKYTSKTTFVKFKKNWIGVTDLNSGKPDSQLRFDGQK